MCIFVSVHNVPHLGLTHAMLDARGIIVVRMHLHRKPVGGVDKFYEQRKSAVRLSHRSASAFFYILPKRHSGAFTVKNDAHLVIADGKLPCLADSRRFGMLAEALCERRAAPYRRFCDI